MILGLQLSQKELNRGREDSKEKNLLIESLRKAARTRRKGDESHERELGEMKERLRYGSCVPECVHGFTRDVYIGMLEYAKFETHELCFDSKSAARSWKNRSGAIGRSAEK